MKPRFEIELACDEYIIIHTKKEGRYKLKYIITVEDDGQLFVEKELRNYG